MPTTHCRPLTLALVTTALLTALPCLTQRQAAESAPKPTVQEPEQPAPFPISLPDAEKIEKGAVLAQWDPYNIPVLSEKGGTLTFKDMIPGVTVKRELDESSGRIATPKPAAMASCPNDKWLVPLIRFCKNKS